MKTRDLGALVLLAALWGASYLFFRIAAPVMGPVPLAWLRVAVAGGSLAIGLLIASRKTLRFDRYRPFLVLGALNGAIPYVLIAFAEVHITASYAAVLNATTPIFAAVVSAIVLRERITRATALGLVMGIVGVAIVVGWSPVAIDRMIVLSIGAMLLSSLTYALAAVFARHAFTRPDPLQVATGQQIGATLLLTPMLLGLMGTGAIEIRLTTGAVLAVVALGLACTAFAYLLYFHLIGAVGPTRTVSVTILSPVFGVAWSAVFLGEAMTWGSLIGAAIILASVGLVTGLVRFGGE